MEKPSDLFGQPNRHQRWLESRWDVCHLSDPGGQLRGAVSLLFVLLLLKQQPGTQVLPGGGPRVRLALRV